jgi:hypothetical protein
LTQGSGSLSGKNTTDIDVRVHGVKKERPFSPFQRFG